MSNRPSLACDASGRERISQRRRDALPATLAPRGLRRAEAAAYIGVSAVTFDRLVEQDLMPKPKSIFSCKVWDREDLDRAFAELPDSSEVNPWNDD